MDASLAAVPRFWKEAHAVLQCYPSRDLARVMLEAAAPLMVAAERERIASHMDALAANYPEDVFPSGGMSIDAIGGTAMRHAYRNAAREIREGKSDGH